MKKLPISQLRHISTIKLVKSAPAIITTHDLPLVVVVPYPRNRTEASDAALAIMGLVKDKEQRDG